MKLRYEHIIKSMIDNDERGSFKLTTREIIKNTKVDTLVIFSIDKQRREESLIAINQKIEPEAPWLALISKKTLRTTKCQFIVKRPVSHKPPDSSMM